MPMNVIYRGAADLPENIPVFPLAGALLLPRGQLPLNIFEPRYLAMIDDSLRDGHRLIGMIQPDPSHADSAHPGPEDKPTLNSRGLSSPCAGSGCEGSGWIMPISRWPSRSESSTIAR